MADISVSKEEMRVAESDVEILDKTSQSCDLGVFRMPTGGPDLGVISSSKSSSPGSSARLIVFPGWKVDTESSSFRIGGICSTGKDGIWTDTIGS